MTARQDASRETGACRTTQHCAFHGWCRRCDPAFAAVMSAVNVAIQRTDADDTHWGPLYAAVGKALRPAAVSVPPPAPRADAATAVRALHQPMQRGPFTICAHCSGWDGKWRCLGVVTDYPCPTIRALDGDPQPVGPCVAGEQPAPPRKWCKCRSCWGWFVEEHPGEDLDELGRDLGWWSGLPVHRDAPAGVAGGQQNETPEAEAGCAHCGKTILRISGTLAEWWVHDPGGHTICFPEQAASSPRATPKPAAGVRQDGAQP